MFGEQLAFDFAARSYTYDYSWRVQCTSSARDRRTGDFFAWYHVADGEAHAHGLAARVMREHPGVTAVVERRRGAA